MDNSAEDSTLTHSIIVSRLVKHFRVHHKGSLKQALLGVFRKQSVEQLTSLNDITISVPHGQTLAVIGKNGSGKSTLLGILARVYRPTSGTVNCFNREGKPARISPLLELGAGFHHELTGLDNITYYGAMLGLNGKQIREKTYSIIKFAELETKIDTTLHGWNDGAKLRLGFSIVVHSDPDILLVDEVLAVGDEAFQMKCYRLIRQMQSTGTTIVFVSHDLAAVERVADRVIWLNQGIIEMDGDVTSVLSSYRESSHIEIE